MGWQIIIPVYFICGFVVAMCVDAVNRKDRVDSDPLTLFSFFLVWPFVVIFVLVVASIKYAGNKLYHMANKED